MFVKGVICLNKNDTFVSSNEFSRDEILYGVKKLANEYKLEGIIDTFLGDDK